MPRDAAIAELVNTYSDASCRPYLLEKLKITREECAARSQSAKKLCPSLIAANLPERIDEKQLSMLVARAAGCHTTTILGKPYNNAPWDHGALEMLKQQHGS